MLMLESEALTKDAWLWFGAGLGLAFLVTIALIVMFFRYSAYHAETEEDAIDLGFVGLILLLVTILYLVAFSFLVAASTKGLDIKLLVAAVDAFVLIGSKLLAPEFLRYLNEEPIGSPPNANSRKRALPTGSGRISAKRRRRSGSQGATGGSRNAKN